MTPFTTYRPLLVFVTVSLISINGLAQPQIQPMFSVQPLTMGQQVTLDCTVTNTNMNEDIEWYHDGDVISLGPFLLRSRDGAYTLQVTQEEGVPSTYHWIITIANAYIQRDEGSWCCKFGVQGVVTDLVIAPCFECQTRPSENNCIQWDMVCDKKIDCFNGTDELYCDVSPLPCVQCDSPWPCVLESWVCDRVEDCYNGEDELNCVLCGGDQYPCFFDNTTCFNASDVCDGIYDCPSGADEFNCTGCFACSNNSTCLTDLQVCNFYNDCPGREDETEDLCNHSQFIKNVEIQTGEWVLFSEGYVSETILDDRETPASNIYDFIHYGFNSDPGTMLYMEIQNFTVSLSGPLVPLVRVSAGSGADPTDLDAARGYIDGYGNFTSISDSMNFSLINNTGFILIAIPKSVVGIFNIIFRVTAIATSSCFECASDYCVKDPEWVCDGYDHCFNGEDELYCTNTQPDPPTNNGLSQGTIGIIAGSAAGVVSIIVMLLLS